MTPPSTLILGPAKSGTTALFYAIRAAMTREAGQEVSGLFEPRDMDAFRRYFKTTGDPVFLCKALLGPALRNMQRAMDRFDRRIVLSRDPRDNIVSRLLFMPPRLLFETDSSKCGAYVDLIRQKQADPGSLSVIAILRRLEALSGRDDLQKNFRDNAILPARVMRTFGDKFWMFGYDELVEQRFGRLSEFLGFEITPDYEVGSQHGYVSRSKGSGEWRSWFLPEDIDFFVREVAEDYALMGFDPEEAADPAPQISPETTTGYVQKQVDRLFAKKTTAHERKRGELEEVTAKAAEAARLRAERLARKRRARAPVAGSGKGADPAALAEARRARRQKRKAASEV